jgi:hypothetical protein
LTLLPEGKTEAEELLALREQMGQASAPLPHSREEDILEVE